MARQNGRLKFGGAILRKQPTLTDRVFVFFLFMVYWLYVFDVFVCLLFGWKKTRDIGSAIRWLDF